MDKYETHPYDVIVIGAGGAGLRAAIEAKSQGASVGLICKSLLGKAHTVMAEGGIAAAMANIDPSDDWKTHCADTLRGGVYVNNWRMAQLHAQEAPERVRELEQWGALFDRTADGRILQRAFGGHKYRRLVHVGDRTGLELIRTLQERTVQLGVDVYMECTVTNLFKEDGRFAGALAYWRESGRLMIFQAKAAVIATGGSGKAYKITSNSWEYAGNGHAMVYDIGAELMDMEFVQFHPTGMVWPPGVRGLLVTESVRGDGGLLKNNKGERFMFKHIPERYKGQISDTEAEAEKWLTEIREARPITARKPPELLPRDIVARAIYNEVKEGRGSEHDGVYLDISHMPAEYVKRKLPSMYMQFKELADVDITKQAMEIGPTMHYMMGGIRVNADSQATNVPGLYAAGECAAGLHGANRLGGNSLSDLIVFGRRAGLYAAEYGKKTPEAKIPDAAVDRAEKELFAPFDRKSGPSPYEVHRELQEVMTTYVGIFRSESDLNTGIQKLQQLREKAKTISVEGNRQYNPGWHLAKDLDTMITVSEVIARGALLRKESRGGHARTDFPKMEDAFSKVNFVAVKDGDKPKVEPKPLPEWSDEIKKLMAEEKK
ncbi:MAG: fumarate reductase/succinate dehydrogenase flavoprotein subunit [Nitrospirae bacterium]|nr:fumarate reductase/succinate dehydrogenase flavoprotein subunit [Nitrospirota bacterium]